MGKKEVVLRKCWNNSIISSSAVCNITFTLAGTLCGTDKAKKIIILNPTWSTYHVKAMQDTPAHKCKSYCSIAHYSVCSTGFNQQTWLFVGCFVQFKPLEQLMGVFPAASGNFLPPTWRNLMSSPVSFRHETAQQYCCSLIFLVVVVVPVSFWVLLEKWKNN